MSHIVAKVLVRLVVAFCCMVFMAQIPVAAYAESGSEQESAREVQAMIGDAQKLLKDIAELRSAELERMQEGIEQNIAQWEEDDAEMDGESLRVQLRKALVVAEARNLPVDRLSTLFEAAKKSILRADYASLCGGGEDITTTLTNVAKTAEEVFTGESADHYFTLSDRAEGKMLCEQEKRLATFKGAWRHYLRALITPYPKEAEENLRQLVEVAVRLNEAEAAVLQADAKVLEAQFGKVETILEMVPVVSDALDVVTAYNGEKLTGEQMSALEKGFVWVNVLVPDAFGMALGYSAKAMGQVAKAGSRVTGKPLAFLWKLAVPDAATKALMKKAGQNLDAASRKAVAMLEWAKARYPNVVEQGAKIARRNADQIDDVSSHIAQTVPGVKFLDPGAAKKESTMPEAWIDALSRTAKNSDTVLIARPVNAHSKELYKARIAAPKPKAIQAKTSELPGIAGFIPTDQAYSKAAEDGAEGIAKKNKQVAEALARGDAISKPITAVDGKTVHTAVDASGNTLVLKDMGGGKYIDVNTGAAPVAAIHDIKPMEALCDPHTGKYYTGDLDMVGVGTRNQSGWTYDKGVGAVKKPTADYSPDLPMKDGKVDEIARMDQAYAGQSGYDELHGAIQGHEQSIHGQINIFARLESAKQGMDKASIVNHGGAGRFVDRPEKSGLTIVLPSGEVGVINTREDLVRVFKACKEKGYKGLEWNPAWGAEPKI
ncbi:MAG: CyaA/EF/ExoY family adenylyl cyclase toxin [Desulfobacterales bacterium]|nr:CyaA/EF/ExoY family adenylyl cyclase toxin [Desulfobacterales bacterium]